MKRSVFLIITAILGLLFGGMMLFFPVFAATNFGIVSTPQISQMLRSVGGVDLCLGILNLLVYNQPDSKALKAILIVNLLSHLISMVVDGSAACTGVVAFSKIAPGLVAHLFIVVGALIYILKMKDTGTGADAR
jgi:hypothetical protein